MNDGRMMGGLAAMGRRSLLHWGECDIVFSLFNALILQLLSLL